MNLVIHIRDHAYAMRYGIGVALLLVWLGVGTAWAADTYHTNGQLHCSDCHIIHASQRGIGFGGGPINPPGFPFLLRGATANELCLTCHDGGTGAAASAPDVNGNASYETSTVKRSAGGFQAPVGVVTAHGHDLSVPNQLAPGGTWNSGNGLSCIHCHEPHGSTNYRNLVLRPGTASSDLIVTDIIQAALTPTSTHYAVGNIEYTGPLGLSAWCQGCHTAFHGGAGDPLMGGAPGGDQPGSNDPWFRHPTKGVNMAQGVSNEHIDAAFWFTLALSRVPVVSPSQNIPGTAVGSDNQPFCGTCHKAHGSPHRAALIWDDPTSSALEDGSSATQTCQACHNM